MYRFLANAFLFIAMALAFWALDLQEKLVLKEKDLLMLRKERDAAVAAEKAARAENSARSPKERGRTEELESGTPASGQLPNDGAKAKGLPTVPAPK